MLAAPDFVEDRAEQQVGSVGEGTGARITLPKDPEIEPFDAMIDAPGQMVGIQTWSQFEASRVVVGPRWRGETDRGRGKTDEGN